MKTLNQSPCVFEEPFIQDTIRVFQKQQSRGEGPDRHCVAEFCQQMQNEGNGDALLAALKTLN